MTSSSSRPLFVTLVGGGNSTHCMAPLVASTGAKVAILTRKPDKWNSEVTLDNEDLGWLRVSKMTCQPDMITSDPALCIPQSDIIFICGLPIHHNPEVLRKWIKPHLDLKRASTEGPNGKVFVGSICAYGGFDWVARRELGNSDVISVFGTQLIPWCCGTKEYGSTGVVFGAKRVLRIATESGNDPDGIKALLQPILRQNLVDCDFLSSALQPNNPSLHPSILYGLFKDWDGETAYDPETLPKKIYAEMTDASADYTDKVDQELVAIVSELAKRFPKNQHLQRDFSLRGCILENYEDQVSDKTDTRSCIRTNAAFGKHYLPFEAAEGDKNGAIKPKLKHKFFETDLPYGLVLYADLGRNCGVPTPTMDAIILWNQKLIGKEYLSKDGQLNGRDIGECIVPSRMGFVIP
eukprot:g839.t1